MTRVGEEALPDDSSKSLENNGRSSKSEAPFSEEILASVRELGGVLEPIYRRLIAEGKIKRCDNIK